MCGSRSGSCSYLCRGGKLPPFSARRLMVCSTQGGYLWVLNHVSASQLSGFQSLRQ